jgi:hypothetical protein
MTDFLTILGNVAAAIFGPWLVTLVAILAMPVSVLWAAFSGSKEAREAGISWKGTLISWLVVVVVIVLSVTTVMYVGQFEPFAWRPLP